MSQNHVGASVDGGTGGRDLVRAGRGRSFRAPVKRNHHVIGRCLCLCDVPCKIAGPAGSGAGTVAGGVMTCRTGAGDVQSTEKFRDAQIHLEFAIPFMLEQKDQMRGNSGVYLHGKYEIQILDSYHNPTYAVGACGAIYGQSPPLVNASRPPEQWQSYDIIFHAAKCDSAGKPTAPATVTVLHNGVLVQDKRLELLADCPSSTLAGVWGEALQSMSLPEMLPEPLRDRALDEAVAAVRAVDGIGYAERADKSDRSHVVL